MNGVFENDFAKSSFDPVLPRFWLGWKNDELG
jgi:hypothetical protein